MSNLIEFLNFLVQPWFNEEKSVEKYYETSEPFFRFHSSIDVKKTFSSQSNINQVKNGLKSKFANNQTCSDSFKNKEQKITVLFGRVFPVKLICKNNQYIQVRSGLEQKKIFPLFSLSFTHNINPSRPLWISFQCIIYKKNYFFPNRKLYLLKTITPRPFFLL